METAFQGNLRTRKDALRAARARGVGWGLIGGLVGTMVMDLILMGAFSMAGMPASTCFTIVGDTVARFFSILGAEMAGGAPLGVMTHYAVGPLIGVTFVTAIAWRVALRTGSFKKVVVLAIVYVEILSQPILAMTPILLKMTAAETLQWFGGSFVMHFIWGAVLGSVVSYGLRRGTAANHGQEA